MDIEIRERGGVRILELCGRLSLGGGAALVHEQVRRQFEEGCHRLLLEMLQVDFVDSTGLGILVSCLTTARQRGGDLKLLSPSPRVSDVLAITQADRLFEIFSDEERAVASFDDGPAPD